MVFQEKLRHQLVGNIEEVELDNNMVQRRTVQSARYIPGAWALGGQTSALSTPPTLLAPQILVGTLPRTRKRQRGADIQVEQVDAQPGVIIFVTSVLAAANQNIVVEGPTIPSPVFGIEGASPFNPPPLGYQHSFKLGEGPLPSMVFLRKYKREAWAPCMDWGVHLGRMDQGREKDSPPSFMI